jgi:hypothetical protein
VSHIEIYCFLWPSSEQAINSEEEMFAQVKSCFYEHPLAIHPSLFSSINWWDQKTKNWASALESTIGNVSK